MARTLLILLAIAASALAFAQFTSPFRVGMIAFYGYDGLDPEKARAVLPFKVGDMIPADKVGETLAQSSDAIEKAMGSKPTDIAPVCCDAQGSWIFYVGLAGKSSRAFKYNPAPTGSSRLPSEVTETVNKIEQELMKAITSGHAKEDDSHGYALSSYPPMREQEEKLRDTALKQEKTILAVLPTSASADDRAAAAMALGYARRSDRQIKALVHASRDAEGKVRNNATRALLVMAGAEPKTARRIPADDFIAMLNSGTWTDRNKGTGLLLMLTARRDPALLTRIRAESLPSLIEMANWDHDHAASSITILGRIAGLPETQIRDLSSSGKTLEIIQAAEEVSP